MVRGRGCRSPLETRRTRRRERSALRLAPAGRPQTTDMTSVSPIIVFEAQPVAGLDQQLGGATMQLIPGPADRFGLGAIDVAEPVARATLVETRRIRARCRRRKRKNRSFLERFQNGPLWRRRELNPRPQPHRLSVYKHRWPLNLARRLECHRPTDEPAILRSRASDDWHFFGAEPVG
jgi:hypothetical protein